MIGARWSGDHARFFAAGFFAGVLAAVSFAAGFFADFVDALSPIDLRSAAIRSTTFEPRLSPVSFSSITFLPLALRFRSTSPFSAST